MRDPETGNSKAFAFINFASFEASDAAIEAMNNQYLCNRPISVSYAFKKDVKGERHGSAAERLEYQGIILFEGVWMLRSSLAPHGDLQPKSFIEILHT